MKGVFDVKAFIGKQEENHAEYQVEPEWRQVMHSPSIDIFSSEPARVGNQGDQRAPDPGIKIEQSIEQFIDEFTEFKRVCITFLSAVGAVVVVVKGSIAVFAMQFGFRRDFLVYVVIISQKVVCQSAFAWALNSRPSSNLTTLMRI